jgi:Flp pilus assembly pilin Flp
MRAGRTGPVSGGVKPTTPVPVQSVSSYFGAICRRLADDQGADLVEYALLASIIAIAGATLFPVIEQKMAAAFSAWGSGVNAVWVPPEPAGP